MDAATRQQYLADDPPTIVPLVIKPHFEALDEKEKSYAHHVSVACFAGTRVVLRSVSPESESIYDFVIAVHKSCGGKRVSWTYLYRSCAHIITRRLFQTQVLGRLLRRGCEALLELRCAGTGQRW